MHCVAKSLTLRFFLICAKVMNVRLCMMALLKLYPCTPFSVVLDLFQGHSSVGGLSDFVLYRGGTFQATARFLDSDFFLKVIKVLLRCICSVIFHPS